MKNRYSRTAMAMAGAVVGLLLLAAVLMRNSEELVIDLKDGTRLELVEASFSTNHAAHFGSPLQKVVFKIAGARLSRGWVGYRMVVPAQRSVGGNLGIFVRHRLGMGSQAVESFHAYEIKPVSPPAGDDAMFLTSGYGEFGLWELNSLSEGQAEFVVENARGEVAGRFWITRDEKQQLRISLTAAESR